MSDNIDLLYLLIITKFKQHYLTVMVLFLVWSVLYRYTTLWDNRYTTLWDIRTGLKKQNEETIVPLKWEPHVLKESCYLIIDDDALPIVHRKSYFPDGTIFFHETSCVGGLTFRQACAVESAARFHPKRQVNVLFAASVHNTTLENSCLSTLQRTFDNVEFARIYVPDYVENTLVREVVSKLVQDAERLDPHVEKITKYLTISKFGGIFLDLDVIVVRPLDKLWRNWAVRDSPNTLSSAMVAFSKNKIGRSLADLTLRMLYADVVLNKGEEYWSFGGSQVIAKALQHWCTTKNITLMTMVECLDTAIYGPDLFYNISFYDRVEYFKPITDKDWNKWKSKRMYTFHVWHRFTKFKVISRESLFSKIAREYCPIMFKYYGSTDELQVNYDDLC